MGIGSTHIKIFIIIVFESFACLCNTCVCSKLNVIQSLSKLLWILFVQNISYLSRMTGFFANSYKQKDMVVDEVSNPAK
uniref:CSON007115 protein n=1 Tax=Culicoides sonorensis TaxID=179676 RepID=A0A336MTM6_CULSO